MNLNIEPESGIENKLFHLPNDICMKHDFYAKFLDGIFKNCQSGNRFDYKCGLFVQIL